VREVDQISSSALSGPIASPAAEPYERVVPGSGRDARINGLELPELKRRTNGGSPL
jgi:hypothetical protein